MKRILVTGSREWTAVHKMRHVIGKLSVKYPDAVLVHGGARGADRLAAQMAEHYEMKTESHPANWDRDGIAAGLIRNQHMVDLGADLAVVFLVDGLPCKGTRDCLRRIEKAEIPYRKYYQKKLPTSNI